MWQGACIQGGGKGGGGSRVGRGENGYEPAFTKFSSAVGTCRGFCRGISMFFSICISKKNAEGIKCLKIFEKYVAKNRKEKKSTS